MPRRGRRGSLDFFFYLRSAREEGNVDNAARDDGGGISWFTGAGSKPADGESESFRNLKATNYKKEPDQGQTNRMSIRVVAVTAVLVKTMLHPWSAKGPNPMRV